MEAEPRLTTAQAAARLGVKPETLYSYVSRGLLSSLRAASGPGSTFDPLDVEALARNRKRARGAAAPAGADMPGSPLMVIDSPLTLIRDDRLYYRGVPADQLARRYSFEDVARWMWSGAAEPPGLPSHPAPSGEDRAGQFSATAETLAAVASACSALGPAAGTVDRLVQALLCAGSRDPFRADLSAGTVRAVGGPAVAAMLAALGPAEPGSRAGDRATAGPGTEPPDGGSVAARLWAALSPLEPTAADIDALNAALILVADHDLAVSTLAARAAASSRADPYAALIAALGAFAGPLHGSASRSAAALLADTMAGGRPERAITAQLAAGNGIPGFGHRLYRRRDPRAAVLLGILEGEERFAAPVRAARQLAAVVASRTPHMPNIDLALAVLAVGGSMAPDAGQAAFAVGRTAGWLAHIMDEYSRRPLRLRPTGHYTGPAPN
ncbi:MAG: citrate synthase [Actinomycetales bacterium]